MPHIGQSLAHLPLGPRGAGDVVELGDAHGRQRQRGEQEGEGIDQEDPARPGPGDHQAGGRGSQQSGGVEGGGVQPDGVGEVPGGHHARHEDLPRRCVIGADHSGGESREVDVPQLSAAGQDVDGQQGRDDAQRRLGDHEELALVDAVGDHPGVRAEQQRRQELERGRGPRGRGRVVREDAQHEPVLGHALHPRAGVGDQSREEPDAVVVELQRLEGAAHNR